MHGKRLLIVYADPPRVFMKDEDIQIQDIRSFTLDCADFVSAISGKFPAKD